MSHHFSFIIHPVNLAEVSTQSSGAVSPSNLVTFSTLETCHAVYLLCSFTVSQVDPVAPSPTSVLADSQVPVVGHQFVGQSLASVGLHDSVDTELCFLVY